MKRILLVSIAMMGGLALPAQKITKFDAKVKSLVEALELKDAPDAGVILSPLSSAEADDAIAQLALVVAPGTTREALEAEGYEVVVLRGEAAVVRGSVSRIRSLEALDCVRSITMGVQQPQLYYSRSVANADAVIDGTGSGLTQPYTGKGVIAGVMDTGHDPNHVNFYNDDLTASRVKAFFNVQGDKGTLTAYLTPEDIASFSTDKKSETHGTHVSGIMAGSYKGTGQYALDNSVVSSGKVPYHGVATGADVVLAGTNILYDSNIIIGIENILQYAEAHGQPAVVNLSIGSFVGAHDGSNPISKYLAAAGKSAVICVASGNDGHRKCAVSQSFDDRNTTLCTAVKGKTASATFNGEMWYSTDEAPMIEFVLYNTATDVEVGSCTLGSSRMTINAKEATIGSLFGQYMASGSSITLDPVVYDVNNRFCLGFSGRLSWSGNVVPMIRVTGKSGEKVEAYVDNGEFTDCGVSGWQDGTSNGSVSDIATGDNIIVSGAFNSSRYCYAIDGSRWWYDESQVVGDIAPFSSYGITFDGRSLPDICSPGAIVTSSTSRYASSSYLTKGSTSALVSFNGRDHRWGGEQGTSMASPFTAGVCALLLEVDPTLGVNDVRRVLTTTAVAPDAGLSSDIKTQWGAGRIDVYRAIMEVLGASGVGSVMDDPDKQLVIAANDCGYEVFVAGASRLDITLYDLQGRAAKSVSGEGNRVDVDVAELHPGVYLMNIAAGNVSYTRKIAVR